MSEKKKIVVLVSGGGTNLQALIDAQQAGKLGNGFLAAVISSKPDAFALTRAKRASIPGFVIQKRDYATQDEYDEALLRLLRLSDADLIVLAGFLTVLSARVCRAYENRIINVHPALIPSFCGNGFYGLRVHEAALACGVKVTGATVHFVNEITDGGAIILQKAVSVQEGDTAEVLQQRVMKEAEWKILPHAVQLFCDERITVENGIAHVQEEQQEKTAVDDQLTEENDK